MRSQAAWPNAEIARFDLGAWAAAHGAHQGPGAEVTLDCPRCGKAGKLCVNLDKRVWHCWVCQQGAQGGRRGAGGVVSLLALVEGLSAGHVADKIRGGYHRGLVPETPAAFADLPPVPLRSLPIPWPAGVRPVAGLESPLVASFMARRRITAADAHACRLHVGTAGRLRDRLVFPVFEEGRLVYYQARALWEAHERPGPYFKALNPARDEVAGTTADHVLLGLDAARAYPEIVLVEGPIDAVVAGRAAVATFGKRLADRQIAKLLRAGVRRVVLAWDGPGPTEPDGTRREMARAAARIAPHMAVRIALLPNGDPASLPASTLAQCLRDARPWEANVPLSRAV